MSTSLETNCSPLHATRCKARLARHLAWVAIMAITWQANSQNSSAQVTIEFHRTLAVSSAEALTLEVEAPNGELQVLYGRDGQVSIAGTAHASAQAGLDGNFFASVLTINQEGNHLSIRQVPRPHFPEKGIKVLYRIEVPYRTVLTSKLDRGKQIIRGILGPVRAVTDHGDITAAYISKGLQAQVESGNLDIEVIGDHVEAKTGRGNIMCSRVPEGVNAETEDGDISLMVVGPSSAIVRRGLGRIDAGGVRGTLSASSDAGELHVKAVPHDNWQLTSVSGTILLELPTAASFEVDATTNSGEFLIDRDDIEKPDPSVRHFRQTVNGGGKRIVAHTETGRIAIR